MMKKLLALLLLIPTLAFAQVTPLQPGNTLMGVPTATAAVPSAISAVVPMSQQSWETGVTAPGYPLGDIRRFGGVGDGSTDSTTAINNWAASVTPGLVMTLQPAGVYIYNPNTVQNGLGFNSASAHNLVIFGNGATIK